MSIESGLVKGVGQMLTELGIGVWRDAGVYAPGEVGIFYAVEPESPASLIVLTPYGGEDSPTLSTTTLGLQVRCRGGDANPKSADDLAARVFDALHSATQVRLSTGVLVTQILRTSWTMLGQDSAQRWTRADNYQCTMHYPSSERT